MIYFAIGLTMLAALMNAVSIVTQRRVAGEPPTAELFRKNFIKRLMKSRLWLYGMLLQIGAFLLQAVALHSASLILVEPLLTTDLIFIMLILHYQYNISAGAQEWFAVFAICLGLSGLMYFADPRNGHLHSNNLHWLLTSIVISIIIGLGIYSVRRIKTRQFRAAVSGLASGFNFALVAGFTKLTVEYLKFGFFREFLSWPVYALIVSGICSVVMMQSTYGAGPLVASQPAMEIAEPIISVCIGIILFGDTINTKPVSLALEFLCGFIAAGGIYLLAGSRKVSRSHL
jgi:hypothetical protein